MCPRSNQLGRIERAHWEGRDDVRHRVSFQTTPIQVEDALIFCSPFNEVIAIDPGTGEENGAMTQKLRPRMCAQQMSSTVAASHTGAMKLQRPARYVLHACSWARSMRE